MKNCYILLFLLTVCANCFSQTFRGLSVREGLPDLVVNALYKDSAGYVWVGTSSSVERFDGIRFKHYSIPVKGEKAKEVNVIAGMPDDEVWIGNNAGLWKVSGDRLERVLPDKIKTKVYSLLRGGQDTLYIGTQAGLYIYDGSDAEHVLLEPNVLAPANAVRGMELDDKGQIWLATRAGLYSLSLAERKPRYYPSSLSAKAFGSVCRLGNTLYLGTDDMGIVAFDMATCTFAPYMDLGHVTALSVDCNVGMLYVGTNGNGVHFIDVAKHSVIKSFRHHPDNPDDIRSNSVYSLLVDRDGIVWVGLFQMGLDYTLYQRNLFSVYQPFGNSELKYQAIRSIEVGQTDKLVGTRDGLFYIDEQRGIFRRWAVPQLRSQLVMCSYAFQGKYYIGTMGGGMYVFDPLTVSLTDFAQEPPFVDGQVFCITSDYDNNLWIGTSDGVFCYKNGKQVLHYTAKNSRLPLGNVYRIFFDSTRRGWVCADGGMAVISDLEGRLITDRFPENFIHRKLIRYIYEDSDHFLYFLPDKGNMFVSNLAMTRFEEMSHSPLEGRNLQFMIEDSERWLWIGTNDGLFRHDKKDTWMSFNFADGVPSSIFLNCTPKADADGVLWFGCARGLFYTDIGRMEKSEVNPYPLQLTELWVDNVSLPCQHEGEFTLDSYEGMVTLRFSDFSYTDPQYMAYEYKLDNQKDAWVVLSGKSELSFYNWSSGRHRLWLRRAGNPESEIVMQFYIPVGVWPYVLGGSVALVFVSGVLFYLWKRRKRIPGVSQLLSLSEEAIDETLQEEGCALPDDKYKSCNMTVEDCRDLTERLKNIMRKDKPYINPKLKIVDLAEMLDVPAYKLSYLFNQYLKRTFYDYVNDYRIAEFKHLVNQGEHKLYTLNTLIEKCGFVSRASFFRYFKKTSGMTPNEYIKKL